MLHKKVTWAPVTSQRMRGFTLLEVLLVVAILALLAGIVIVAINPGRQLANSRNAQRNSDVKTILNAIYQYNIDNAGVMPSTITTTATDVCNTTGSNCTGLIDLGVLTASSKYLVGIPKDPQCASLCATYSTGYKVSKDVNNRITVSSTYSELGATITVSR
jgi:prepilin-type N-terminal cleavage/methylation domain-containing protein